MRPESQIYSSNKYYAAFRFFIRNCEFLWLFTNPWKRNVRSMSLCACVPGLTNCYLFFARPLIFFRTMNNVCMFFQRPIRSFFFFLSSFSILRALKYIAISLNDIFHKKENIREHCYGYCFLSVYVS